MARRINKRVLSEPEKMALQKERTYKILDNIKDNWAIYGAVASGSAYILAYFKAAFFLGELKVIISPIDVYSALSLFVSGITTIFTGLIVPVTAIIAGWTISWFSLSSRSRGNGLILFSVLLSLIGELFLMFISRLPGNIYVIPFFFAIFGQGSWKEVATLIVLVSVQIIFSYYAFRKSNVKLWMTSVVLLAILWFGLFVYAQIATFPELKYIPVGAVQQSGMRGIISTELPISQQSKKIEKFSKVYFETHGMLLNRYDQTYYFIPIGDEVEGNGRSLASICVLPSARVFGFYGDRDEILENSK